VPEPFWKAMRMSPLDWVASAYTPPLKASVVTPPAPNVLSRLPLAVSRATPI
jgi:hypothetical protein